MSWFACLSSCCCTTALGVAAVLFVVLWFLSDHVPRLNLNNKHVLITGGSQGIGKELAKCVATKGASVSIIARKQEIIDEALKEIRAVKAGVTAVGLSADVGDRKQVTEVVQRAATTNSGRIDVLVCNAGFSRPGLVEDQPEDEYDRTMRVNYLGCVYAVRAALPYMPAGSRIVLVGSMAGLTGVAGYTSYCPSKFAVRGLAESLAMELRPRGITVSVAVPPDVDTPGFQTENKTKPEETRVADNGVFTPQQVAQDITAGIESWRFMITTGFDGYLLGTLCTATAPVHSPAAALFQVFTAGVLRIVMLGYQKKFAFDLNKIYHRKNKAK